MGTNTKKNFKKRGNFELIWPHKIQGGIRRLPQTVLSREVGFTLIFEQLLDYLIKRIFDTFCVMWLLQLEYGGFRDKPGKPRDFYHTCYCLSGLSVCQHSCSKDYDSPSVPGQVLGPYSNLLEPVHPLYNVVLKQYREVREFFSRSWAKLNWDVWSVFW